MLRAWLVRHWHSLEQTKTFVLGFVFVLAHEQVTTTKCLMIKREDTPYHYQQLENVFKRSLWRERENVNTSVL